MELDFNLNFKFSWTAFAHFVNPNFGFERSHNEHLERDEAKSLIRQLIGDHWLLFILKRTDRSECKSRCKIDHQQLCQGLTVLHNTIMIIADVLAGVFLSLCFSHSISSFNAEMPEYTNSKQTHFCLKQFEDLRSNFSSQILRYHLKFEKISIWFSFHRTFLSGNLTAVFLRS